MPQPAPAPAALAAQRSPWLRGPIRVPGDRAVTRLALLLAGLARGETVLESPGLGPDIAAFIAVLGQLGVPVARRAGRLHVEGFGIGGLLPPEGPIDLAAVGEGAPLLIALLATHDFEARFVNYTPSPAGDALLDFLRRNGARIVRDGVDLTTRGPRFPIPLDLGLPAEALPLKAPLLLQALVTRGTSSMQLPEGIADPSDGLIESFGAKLTRTTGDGIMHLVLEGMLPLKAQTLVIPGDPVFAAYPALAAMIAPDSELTIESISVDHSRMTLLDALQRFGGQFSFGAPRREGRDTADLIIRTGKLTATTIAPGLGLPIEDYAILAVAAAFAAGETLLEGVGEGPRRLALSRALRDNGVECIERPEGGLLIRGAARVPGGGNVAARLDPKLAMAFLVLGMAADKPVGIDDGGIVEELFPDFVAQFEHVGVSFSTGKPA